MLAMILREGSCQEGLIQLFHISYCLFWLLVIIVFKILFFSFIAALICGHAMMVSPFRWMQLLGFSCLSVSDILISCLLMSADYIYSIFSAPLFIIQLLLLLPQMLSHAVLVRFASIFSMVASKRIIFWQSFERCNCGRLVCFYWRWGSWSFFWVDLDAVYYLSFLPCNNK
jgi:hypothetical protein